MTGSMRVGDVAGEVLGVTAATAASCAALKVDFASLSLALKASSADAICCSATVHSSAPPRGGDGAGAGAGRCCALAAYSRATRGTAAAEATAAAGLPRADLAGLARGGRERSGVCR